MSHSRSSAKEQCKCRRGLWVLGHETYPQRTAAAPAPRCRARREAARWLFWCHTRGNVHDGLKRRFRPSPLPSRVFPHLDHDTRQRTARRGTQDNPAASSPARRLPRQVPGSNARQCSLSPAARTLGVELLPTVPALRAGTRVRGLGCPQYSADRGHQVRFVNAVRTQGPLTLNE